VKESEKVKQEADSPEIEEV